MNKIDSHNPANHDEIDRLRAENERLRADVEEWKSHHQTACLSVAKLRSQLPSEMQDCTIQFKECEVGHGRLTATNWIDDGCPYCRIAKLRAFMDHGAENAKLRAALEAAKRHISCNVRVLEQIDAALEETK